MVHDVSQAVVALFKLDILVARINLSLHDGRTDCKRKCSSETPYKLVGG